MFHPLLTAFVCVADCGSFNKAAERLYISPPSVMKQINALEKHLEIKLFDRNNQGIRLTAAGQVVYRHAQFLIGYSAKAIEEAKQQEQVAAFTFCIGSSLLNPCKPFMDLWYQVNQAFPGYKLHIVPFDDSHMSILSEIETLGEKYDFIVAACDSAAWLERCNFQRLGVYQVCCAVSREHPLAQRKCLTIENLYGETLMMVKRGDSSAIDTVRDEVDRHPEIQIEDTAQFYDMEVFNRCAQTQNVMLTLECWKDVHPSLVTLPVNWSYTVPYGVLYAKHANREVLEFLSLVQNYGISSRISDPDADAAKIQFDTAAPTHSES